MNSARFLELQYFRRGFQAYKLPDLSTGYDFQHLETLLWVQLVFVYTIFSRQS